MTAAAARAPRIARCVPVRECSAGATLGRDTGHDRDRGRYVERGDRDGDSGCREKDPRGYFDEDRPRRRVKICVEYENGDEYCRYRR